MSLEKKKKKKGNSSSLGSGWWSITSHLVRCIQPRAAYKSLSVLCALCCFLWNQITSCHCCSHSRIFREKPSSHLIGSCSCHRSPTSSLRRPFRFHEDICSSFRSLYKTVSSPIRKFVDFYVEILILEKMNRILSAQQSVELIDIYAWHFFWFIICLLLIMCVADIYHARNGNLKWFTFDFYCILLNVSRCFSENCAIKISKFKWFHPFPIT